MKRHRYRHWFGAALGLVTMSALHIEAAEPVEVARTLGLTAMEYLYGSGDPERGGLDCSGFVQVVFRRAYGVELPDEAGKQYLHLREHGQVWDATTGWKPDDLRPGDLIFWSGTHPTRRPSPITHVMVYLGDNTMAGAQSAGRRLNASGWGVGLYRFRPSTPTGNPLIDQEAFRHKLHLYAYGRVVPPPARPSAAADLGLLREMDSPTARIGP